MTKFSYSVRGRWPFPTDMLRFDDSSPATEADRLLMERLSTEHADHLDRDELRKKHEIRLMREGRDLPFGSDARWRSFSWAYVDGSGQREP